MSWHFSRALEEAFSAVNCSGGEPSAQLNESPTPQAYLSPDRMTAFSRLSRFGMTFAPLTGSRGAELLTWFLAGFPAKTSAALEKERESTEREAGYGAKWQGSFATYSPATSSWKTAQCSLLEDSDEFSETWPRWGLMRDGECFPVTMQAEFTYASASGLRLPTPRSCSAMAARITENTANAKFPNLETVLARLTLPTLGANEGKGSSKKRFIGSPDFRGAKMSEGLRTCEQDPIYLNPLFGELTMMWPLGWTDLKPSEMGKFQEWWQQHGECLEALE